jgi:DnaJ family protein C protein 2
VAHRRKVLRHHPDKKAKAGETNDDAFFKCIQKAFEVLSNPDRRRQFDSVDPYFIALEQDEPTAAELAASPQAFFDTLGPMFEREARFSKNPPGAPLGGIDAPKEVVHHFYDYWYNFDSWRSFEYRDKEVNEGSDSRDDKRYTEKKNKNERARMKKEDTARVRGLVDLAEKCDPRIKRIKQEEKEAREAKRKATKPGLLEASPVNRPRPVLLRRRRGRRRRRKRTRRQKRQLVLKQKRPKLQLPMLRRRQGAPLGLWRRDLERALLHSWLPVVNARRL